MNDQQDLRARLPELPEPSIKVMGAINKNAPMNFYQGYTADQMRAYALEAAAQLGRVGEPVAQIFHECGGNHIEWIGIAGERDLAPGTKLYTSPQLPAGVPDGWALVPVKPTESMLEALGNTPWVIDGHTEGNTFIQKEYRDQRYVTDGWEAMLNAAPSPPATPQPDSAAPDGDVEQRARELLAAEYEKASGTVKLSELVRKGRSPTDTIAIRAIIAALSAPKQVGVAIGFRYRMKGHSEGYEVGDWHYNYHRDPDSFELRECEIETVWAGNASPQAAPKQVGVDGKVSRMDEFDVIDCPGCGTCVKVVRHRPQAAPVPVDTKPDPTKCYHKFPMDPRRCVLCGWDFRNGEPVHVEGEGNFVRRWSEAIRELPMGRETPPPSQPVPVEGEPIAVTRHVAGFKPGPLFNQEEWDRLRSLPKGTKLYVSPPSQPAEDLSAALEKATDRIVASRAERPVSVECDETIDCEIAVAPATIFGVGVKLSTVVSAIRSRKDAEGTFAFTTKVRDRVEQPAVELEQLRSLACQWRIQDSQIGQGPAGNKARRKCANDLLALIDGAKGGEL